MAALALIVLGLNTILEPSAEQAQYLEETVAYQLARECMAAGLAMYEMNTSFPILNYTPWGYEGYDNGLGGKCNIYLQGITDTESFDQAWQELKVVATTTRGITTTAYGDVLWNWDTAANDHRLYIQSHSFRTSTR